MIVINSDRGIDTKTSKPNSLEYPLNGTIGLNTIQSWWGNTVFTKTGDWNSVSLKTVGPGQTFGCVYFSISFFLSFLFFFALRSTLLCSFYPCSLPEWEMPWSVSPCRPEMRATFLSTPFLSSCFLSLRRLLFFPVPRAFSPLFWTIASLTNLGAVHRDCVQRHVLRNMMPVVCRYHPCLS